MHEGEPAAVIAEMEPVSERLFGAWSMGYAGNTELFEKLCAEYGYAGGFDPKSRDDVAFSFIALWLIWIKGPMAIERLDLATALPSMARSVLRCSLGPRSGAVSTTRMATCHLSRPWSREVAWGRQCDCIHSAGGHIAGGAGYDLRHSTEGLPSGV